MASANFALESALLNYLPANHMNVETVDSRLDCANRCLYFMSCLSMVYNTVSGSCYLYNAAIPTSPTGPTDMNLLMYNADGRRCNSTGWPWIEEEENIRVCLTANGYVYEESMDFCYKHHPEGLANPAAVSACEAEGGRGLARLDTLDKLTLFMNMIPSQQYTHVDGYQVGGTWVYPAETNPQTTPYLQWSPGQPNNPGSQDCLAVDSTGLHDAYCDTQASFPFICEM